MEVLTMQRSKWVLSLCAALAVTAVVWQVNVHAGDATEAAACEKVADCSAAKADCDLAKACCPAKSVQAAAASSACSSTAPAVLANAAGVCEESAPEIVRLTNGVAVVYTVASGCPESTKALKATLASTCPKSAAHELAKNCTTSQELLASGSVTIDKVLFRTGGMIPITSSEPSAVAALQNALAPEAIQTAMAM